MLLCFGDICILTGVEQIPLELVVEATVLKIPDGMDEMVELAPCMLPLLLEVLTRLVDLLLLTEDCCVNFVLVVSAKFEVMGTLVLLSIGE